MCTKEISRKFVTQKSEHRSTSTLHFKFSTQLSAPMAIPHTYSFHCFGPCDANCCFRTHTAVKEIAKAWTAD
jgi:hypothetical protein